jgi:hypothetical protein
VGDTTKYRYKGSPSTGWPRSGGLTKYAFNSWKAFSHSGFFEKAFFKILKNGRHLSIDWEMNRFSTAILLVSCQSCLVLWGACISRLALTFSLLASIPHQKTMKPRNFLEATPKAHFDGLSFISYCLKVSKASERSTT